MPEHFDAVFGALVQQFQEALRAHPFVEYEPALAISRVIKLASGSQALQQLHTLEPFRPELRQIHFE